MAMTKAEKVAMQALRDELALARAFRWTEEVLPDVPPPLDFDVLTTGWLPIAETTDYRRVEEACSSAGAHAIGRTDHTTSQRPVALYSTRLLALRAMRYKVERHFADALAHIDKEIEREREAK